MASGAAANKEAPSYPAAAKKASAAGPFEYVFVVDDQRVVAAVAADGPDALQCITLPHPKYGTLARYLVIPPPKPDGAAATASVAPATLLEIQSVRDTPSAWFVGDSVVSDGALYVCTRVDPLWFALQPLTTARAPTSDKPDGLFCQLSQVFGAFSAHHHRAATTGAANAAAAATPSPALGKGAAASAASKQRVLSSPSASQVLLPLLMHPTTTQQLALVCDTRDIGGGEHVYRLSDAKLRAWLRAKVDALTTELMRMPQHMPIAATTGSGSTAGIVPPNITKTAIGLVSEYLSDDHTRILCECYGLTPGDVFDKPKARKATAAWASDAGTGSGSGSGTAMVTADADMSSAANPRPAKQQKTGSGAGVATKQAGASAPSRAAAKLAKGDTKGMKSLSSFFGKAPAAAKK